MAMARRALRQRREQQGWTQESIAHKLGVEPATYRSWERGEKSPRPGRRPKLAQLLDVSLAEVGRLLDRQGPTNGHAVPEWLGGLASLEQGATEVWAYEAIAAPGLLQTIEYATAVERSDTPRSDEAIARRVDLRMARQCVLTRAPNPVELSVVLDESALHRRVGDADVMAGQLDHLRAMAQLPHVDLRVLPFSVGVVAFGSFTLFTRDGPAPYMACVEDRAGPHYLDRRPEVEAHVALFEHLVGLALEPAESIDLIDVTTKEHYR